MLLDEFLKCESGGPVVVGGLGDMDPRSAELLSEACRSLRLSMLRMRCVAVFIESERASEMSNPQRDQQHRLSNVGKRPVEHHWR